MGKGGEMSSGKGDESGGYENPNYPVVIGEDGVPRIGACAVDPLQSFKSTELQLWPIFGNKLSFARPHMRAFHFQWLSFFMAFMVWFAYAPLLVVIRQDLNIAKKGIWMSNVFNVAACVVARFVVGPLGDVYGSVKVQTALLGFCGICTFFAGFVNSLAELCLMRFLIGVGGATFVITQLWSSEMFAKNVVGAANAMTGGWGNCGGGMAIMIMGYIYEGFRDEGMSQENAWRRSFYIPAVAVMLVAVCMFFFSDECPSGKLSDALAAGKREKVTVKESTRGGFTNLNSWILFVQYATCFGIELHINNGMAMYFKDTYPVSLATAGLIASLFGWMNLFARGLGGYFSDLANAKLGMQGRIIVHTLYLLAEGAILVIFSRVDSIAHAIITLVLFSCCVQAAEGTTFAIVPYVAPKALGSVSGVVGAGGNVGAVAWGLMFMFGDSGKTGYRNLGIIIMASALLSVFIKIKGAGSLFGNDDSTEGDEAPAAKGEEI